MLAAPSQTTTHAPSGRCRPVGKALSFSREDCCCNLYHTNICHYQQDNVCSQIYLHTSKHMHTHKHLSPPSQKARMSKCVFLRSRHRPKPSKLPCWDKCVCCVCVCPIVSGRCLLCFLCIMIKLCSPLGGMNSRRGNLGQLQPHGNEAPAEAQLRSEQTGTQEVFLCVNLPHWSLYSCSYS